LAELRKRGFRVVDTDEPGWCEWSESDGGYVWREEPMLELLGGGPAAPLPRQQRGEVRRAPLLAEAVDLERLPQPLAALLARVGARDGESRRPAC
jgi:hypothetical protein